jgi:hypothetical protein
MLKKSSLFLVFLALALCFGCKDKNESEGNALFQAGKYRQAINFYIEAHKKGKVSDEFYDNFVIAYAGAAKEVAEKNPTDSYVIRCIDQIYKNLPNAKTPATSDSVASALSAIGLAQVKGSFGYEYTLQGFRYLDSAISIAGRGSTVEPAKKARKEAEEAVVKEAIENSKNFAGKSVAAEYILLEAEVVAPDNKELQKALNEVRLKNRDKWLIFNREAGVDRPSSLVNKYVYVIYFPILSIGSKSTSGEIHVYNQGSNNVDFDFGKIKMVSTKGEEVYAKLSGGDCYTNEIEGDKRAPLKGTVGKLLTGKICRAKASFSYESGFVPDYVDYKDGNNNNMGRKYFGYK